ncbi:UNVERIFIED_CONTAM: hypothetical protein Slati_4420600 [Sesamum latifolium]|uniref:Endonuclease/exonuclease/phosphatase domain-containing protein n=1 Tax=Sesamum latifolium TaxID=2727402 RepID=A0AAW2SPZ3_9LAMI
MAETTLLAEPAPNFTSSHKARNSKDQQQHGTYAKIVQQPSAAHFQHDPVQAAKKTFLDDEMCLIGSYSSYKGEPSIIYSSKEMALLAAILKFTLVGKFFHGLPNLNFLHLRIVKLGLKGNVIVGRLNFKHVLIRLTNEEDFSRLWLRGHIEMDLRPPGNTPIPNEEPRDLREIINNKRKRKAVANDNTPVTLTVEHNIDKGAPVDLPIIANDIGSKANDVSSSPLHVPESELSIEPDSYRSGHVEVATPDDFNYDDPLIAELLDRDWDAENKSRNVPHSINIEVVEGMDKESEQDTFPSMVPNSHFEETSPKAAGTIKKFFQGETSRQRCTRDQSQEHPSPEAHTIPLDSEGEEELTPVSNRFQSLEDMKMEDILQHIKNMQKASTDTAARTSSTYENTLSMEHPIQEGEASQQELIFTDSTVSNKHKRNKSLEEATNKSPKTASFVYAKCNRNSRKLLWEELVKLSSQDVPWLVGGDFNIILHPNENQGGGMRKIGPIDDFNDMMLDIGLIDASFEGDPFTWTNIRIWKRLDRVLYSKEWVEILNITRVLHLPRRLSDHHPLFIDASKIENKKPSSFRFQNMWLQHHSFLETVKQSWDLPIEGYGMYKLQQKIYITKELLKQ